MADATAVRERKRPSRRRAVTGFLFFAPFLLVFVVAIVAPLVYAMDLSLFRRRLIGGTSFVGLDNYVRAANRPAVPGRARSRGAVPGRPGAGHAAARAVRGAGDRQRTGCGGRSFFRLGVFLPYAVPAVVATLMWGFIYGGQFGLTGQITDAFGVDPPDLLGPTLDARRRSATSSPGSSSATTC